MKGFGKQELLMAEITYCDPDDPFEEYSWKYPVSDFEKRFLRSVRRKYYAKQVQAKRIRSIERGMQGDIPKYPPDYVEGLIEWAHQKNRSQTVIILDTLISTIRNPDNLTKYMKHSNTGQKTSADDYGYTVSW
jgi:hypothetical protein